MLYLFQAYAVNVTGVFKDGGESESRLYNATGSNYFFDRLLLPYEIYTVSVAPIINEGKERGLFTKPVVVPACKFGDIVIYFHIK